jgi:hypothetical protein
MHTKEQRVINCLIQSLLVYLNIRLSLFSLMYGAQHQIQLVVINTMLALWMTRKFT